MNDELANRARPCCQERVLADKGRLVAPFTVSKIAREAVSQTRSTSARRFASRTRRDAHAASFRRCTPAPEWRRRKIDINPARSARLRAALRTAWR